MLVDLTDKEIEQLGIDRWLRSHALKIAIWFLISLACAIVVALVNPDYLSIIARWLIVLASEIPLFLGIIIIVIKMDKAGKTLLKEIKGANN